MSRTHLVVAGLAAVGALAAPMLAAPDAHAASAVQFRTIYFDPPGADYRGNANVNREWVSVRNVTRSSVKLAGWRIRDAHSKHTFVFPSGYVLRAGATVTIRSGKGRNSASTLYWNQGFYVWNNTGDTGVLSTPRGATADTCSYKGPGTSKAC